MSLALATSLTALTDDMIHVLCFEDNTCYAVWQRMRPRTRFRVNAYLSDDRQSGCTLESCNMSQPCVGH